jgi:hypothetical protein
MAKNISYTIRRLRVKNPGTIASAEDASNIGSNIAQEQPCKAQLTSLLTCWRHNGVDSTACSDALAALETCRRASMKERPKPQPKSDINNVLRHYLNAMDH